MRLWWEIAKRGFRRFATYRGATFAGAFTNSVFAFVKAYILIAVYRERTDIGGFDLTDSLTYAFVIQGFIMVVGIFGGYGEIGERIRTGDIVTDFYRPADFLWYWLSMDLGRAAFQVIFRGLPPFLVGALVFHLRVPQSPEEAVGFAASVALAIVASFGLRFLISMSGFWLLDPRGPVQILSVTWMFFAGFLVPLDYFPGWLEGIARSLPFASMLQVPVEVFLGKHHGVDLLVALGGQVFWIVVLLGACRLVLAAATHRVVVQGG